MVAPIVRDPLSSTRKKDIGWFEQSNGWMRLSTSLDPHHLQIDCHQGCGGCPVRDNPGDPGRAVLQFLCPRRRHHNDRGWNGHLQHRQECRQIQGDCLRLQILPDWNYSGFFLQMKSCTFQECKRTQGVSTTNLVGRLKIEYLVFK